MRSDKQKLISICIPVLNEQDNLMQLYSKLLEISRSLETRYIFEFIFTDNHSSDDTWSLLRELADTDIRVKGLKFTKNIGFQESILANMRQARGHALIQIDADLQDPPELLVEFLNHWESGFKVVYGIRTKRKESWFISLFRRLGYRFISSLSDYPIPSDVGDFRLIDESVAKLLLDSNVPNPYLRGIIASYEIPSFGVSYSRDERKAGKSKFPLRKILHLGLNGVLNHSSWPLKFATYSGITILISSVLLSTYYIFLRMINHNLPQGLASIHILVIFGIGMNALFLGIIGDYIKRIYVILRNEPRFVVQESFNLQERL